MNASRGGVGLRLFVSGNAEAKRDFREFRDEGKRAFAEIAGGARSANPALLATSRAVGEVKDGVSGLADRAGAAGRVVTAFGVAGVGAAAALGGLSIAIAQTRQAMAFADEIGDSATKVGIGTDALQEWRFAVHQAGGEAQDADSAIAGFTKALGAAQSNLSPRAMKPFAALGFTREQLNSFGSAEDALVEVAARVAALSKESERAAVAERLGLTPMLPLLRNGAEGIANLREEARQLGVVMDEDLVAKAGEANDRLEVMQQVIDIQLKSAFVELAPVIVDAAEAIADLVRALANFSSDPRVQQAIRIAASIAKGYAQGPGKGMAAAWGQADELIQLMRTPAGVDWSKFESPERGFRKPAVGDDTEGTRLTPPPAKPKKKTYPTDGAVPLPEPMTSIDLETGQLNRPRSQSDWAYKEAFGFFPGEKIEPVKVPFEADLVRLDDAVRPWLEDMRAEVEDTFTSGVRAAFSGDLLDWLKYRVLDSLASSAGDGLADLFMNATKGSGGGLGGMLAKGASWLFGFGRNAVGGGVRAGEASTVAEYGEELAIFGRDGQVFSHEDTVRMIQEATAGRRGEGSVQVAVPLTLNFDARGAGPREVDALKAQQARLREELPAIIVQTVNDAIQRRTIASGG